MFEEMAKSPAAWLSGSGSESLVVLSTRVRLARNVAGCSFPTTADSETRKRVIGYIDSAITRSTLLSGGQYVKAADVDNLDRDFLVERHLISPVFLNGELSKALLIGPAEQVSVMINEEDHLRIQALTPGLDPQGAFDQAVKYETEIGKYLEFDYDPDFGYMTACPTNAGTGMRASVLIHLPGLVLTQDIEKVISRITHSGLMVRGFYGEGSDVLGNLFQISNQNTLGVSEDEIMQQVTRAAQEIIEHEATARQQLMDEAADMMEDRIWRAFGILKYGRMLTSDEVMNLLSAVRLGHAIGMIDFLSIAQINEILLLSQPAHLQKYYGQEMDTNRRDFVRAQMVREKLRNSG
jgi:protein arginine kinase